MHQLVEYGIAGGLIMMSAQSTTPVAPILVSVAVLLNAAISDGPMSAYSWLSRRVHRILDWAVIAVALVCMVSRLPRTPRVARNCRRHGRRRTRHQLREALSVTLRGACAGRPSLG
jgi:hypothetical protein